MDEWKERLDQSYWCLATPTELFKELSASLPYVRLELDKVAYGPVLEALAENRYAPKTLFFSPKISEFGTP